MGSRWDAFWSPTPGAPTPAQVTQYDAAAAAATPNVGDAIHNWLFGDPTARAQFAQQQAAGATLGTDAAKTAALSRPDIMQQLQTHPVAGAIRIGPVLDAAVAQQQGRHAPGLIAHNTIDGPVVKPDDNPAHTKAVSDMLGTSAQGAHLLTQKHHYTEDEWVRHAQAEGITNNQLQQMWGMQHYLNPQQQALSGALNVGSNLARPGAEALTAAQQQYYAMLRIAGGLAIPMPEAQPPAN
jgi:hypothetical protein